MGTTVRYIGGDQGGVVRYVQGWKGPEQDRRPPPKIARIISQEYDVIKRECLAQQALWEDPSFPATDRALFPSQNQPLPFQWKRPGELASDPRMFVDGFTRFDVVQGELGNCWFLAATASLCATRDLDLFHHVLPLDNLFVKDYAGVFHFRIWQYGKWVDIVVDDRLPTLNGRLVFVHSPTHNEFWPALLEKAYAKLNGSYEALDGGNASEAMEDFTGGVTETFDLDSPTLPKDMFTIMKKAFERKSLMGCTIDPAKTSVKTREGKLSNGLIVGHAYSITAVRQCKIRGQLANLIRIRNPWGNEAEWIGSWSDRSPEWNLISEEDKKTLMLNFEDDGEFWMSFEDFIRNFSKLELCMTTPAYETLTENVGVIGSSNGPRGAGPAPKRAWQQTSHVGTWKKNVNAGGCPNPENKATFWTNPQYRVQVVDPDEDDDDNTGTIVVALMQKERRKKKQEGLDYLYIGYLIYKIDEKTTGPLDATFFRYNVSVGRSSTFTNIREIVGRHKLTPGAYVIIPCTYQANMEGDFLLRIFSENKAKLDEMDEETGFIDNKNVKVKDDVPIFKFMDGPGSQVIKGHVTADSETTRLKTQAVTGNDVNEEREMKELFKNVSGVDLEVDAYELRAILDANFKAEFAFEGVNLETARSMVAMMDVDHSGKLGYDEFKRLWTDLRRWKKIFKEYDRNQNSTLDSFELRAALNSAGFRVSNQTFKCLVMRYSDPSKGQLFFDDFILCAVRLKTMFDTFKSVARDESKPAQFMLDEFIQTTMYS